jgi:hypothetical protein
MGESSSTQPRRRLETISPGGRSTVRQRSLPHIYPSVTHILTLIPTSHCSASHRTAAHINNLYNTAFWALIHHSNLSPKAAHETLRGTASGAKHEILFSRFGINYNDLSLRFRKGSVLVRQVRIGLCKRMANTDGTIPLRCMSLRISSIVDLFHFRACRMQN